MTCFEGEDQMVRCWGLSSRSRSAYTVFQNDISTIQALVREIRLNYCMGMVKGMGIDAPVK
ncbi:MAG: hypothetical protein ABIE47_17935 [Pseudomonadota bacterium]|jgi:hypothetical protein|nr:hypothetical protein [Desulfobacterales bacterium]MBL6966943.1 hypothetical protein [Desulfobacteraceae bacterium]MBU0733094.1 hypothetical protein [Pseudomonadota bacterium]MBL7101523.1 hypothetical protein [Desulfobacteraceae bacterium]MBL7173408.1 hypothetical protein [Desulfobacteraceae bacterium]